MKTLQQKSIISPILRTILALTIVTIAVMAVAAQSNTFPSSGNAGVGTTNPGTKLEVVGTHVSGKGLLLVKGASDHGYIYVDTDSPATKEAGLNIAKGGATKWGMYVPANSNDLRFYDSADRLTLQAGGNVGIGTTTPFGKLEVVGSVYSSASETNTVFSGAVGNNNAAFVGPQGYWAFRSDTAHRFNLDVYNSGSPLAAVTVNQAGNVGIGTTNPTGNEPYSRFTVGASDGVALATSLENGGTGQVGFILRRTGGTASRWYPYIPAGSTDLRFYSGSDLVTFKTNGNVGIGTTNPQYPLDVNGNINSNATITGNNIVAKYQDVAEWVPSTERLSPGTVVVLDTTRSNQVVASTVSYDTRVAGVISAQPGITLGEGGEGKVVVATTGRVRVKVDASRGQIQIGDLLVTSDIPGMAMKSQPVNLGGVQFHRPGTIIGKALELLAKGKGEILVLLSLQ